MIEQISERIALRWNMPAIKGFLLLLAILTAGFVFAGVHIAGGVGAYLQEILKYLVGALAFVIFRWLLMQAIKESVLQALREAKKENL